MATAMASIAVSLPLGKQHRFCFARSKGLCLQSHPLRRHTVAYGLSRRGRKAFLVRPLALAEQQASQTEVEEAEEGNDNGAGDAAPVNGADGKASEAAPSQIPVLLRSYSEAVLAKDQEAMSSIQSQLEMIEKENSSLGQLVANLTEEVSLAKDRLLRLNADFDNYRKRSDREKDSLRENVKGDVIESLLPMIDNFERAKSAIKAETEGEKKIDSSYQGIYKQFVDIMKGLGVKVIDTVGKEFNPEIHEAIMREESSEFQEGFIIQEFRRGFMLGKKLLRPAMVKVSAGSSSATPPAPEASAQATEVEATTSDAAAPPQAEEGTES